MDLISTERLDTIRALFDKRDYAGCLAECLKSDRTNLEGEQLSEAQFFHAACLFYLGDYDSSLSVLMTAIEKCRNTGNHLLYARQKQLLGALYSAIGKIDDAIEEYNEAYAARRRAGDDASICASLVSLAMAHVVRGELLQGRSVLRSALRHARLHNTANEVNVCERNLCMVAWLTGNFADFVAIVATLESENPRGVERARIDELRGKCSASLLEYDRSRKSLKGALAFYEKEQMLREQAICYEFLGLNEYFAGNHAAAKEYYQRVLDMPEPRASAIAQTLRMLTDVLVAEGQWQEAEETAAKAEQAITKINERIELGALHRAYGQICAHRGEKEKAREYFGKSVDLLKELGARYELALSHLAAGKSEAFSDAERGAQLELARELFVEMDVPKRVAEVKSVIAGLSHAKPQGKNVRAGRSSIEDPDIITRNPRMMQILSEAARFAKTNMSILITGETGTGKDLLAERIHCLSPRHAGPYRNENMSRFPRDLVDAELFGYERGSHSLASTGKAGLIELTDGGTFCLNEVAELPPEMQARLLQVIEEGTVRRVGGGEPRPVDVRFIAMTNCDLDARVEARLFRHDLLFRLRVGHLHIPPLRERMDDLPLLVQYFLKRMEFADYTLAQTSLIVQKSGCDRYHWPGNVRDLVNVISRAVTLTPSADVMGLLSTLTDVMERLPEAVSEASEKEALIAALRRFEGNQSKAADHLRISRTTLRYRMQRYGLS